MCYDCHNNAGTMSELARHVAPPGEWIKLQLFHMLQHVGCDWVIDSAAKEDRCGMCHGDGSTCQTVKDEYNNKVGTGKTRVNDSVILY